MFVSVMTRSQKKIPLLSLPNAQLQANPTTPPPPSSSSLTSPPASPSKMASLGAASPPTPHKIQLLEAKKSGPATSALQKLKKSLSPKKSKGSERRNLFADETVAPESEDGAQGPKIR